MSYTRCFEIITGCIVSYINTKYLFVKKEKYSFISQIFSLLGLSIIILSIFLYSKSFLFPGIYILFPLIGAIFILISSKESIINKQILAFPVLVYIGLISYSLYIWHWPIIVFSKLYIQSNELHINYTNIMLLCLFLSLLFSSATYTFMEKPIRKSQSFIYTLFLILGMMLSAIFASYVIYNEGLSNRFAENAKPYLSFQYNFENESPYPNCWRDQGPFSADSYFPKMCVPETNKPLVFLIGDSHAGCLYKGLVHESDGQFEIAPLMQSSCPPLFFEHNNSCSKSQKETYELILKRQPEIVILFAWWGYGAHTPQATDGLYLDILKSIKKLKEAGVRNIIILGPAPNWEGSSQNRYEASLPHNMAELVTKRQLPSAPRYTNYKLRNDQKQMDTLLSEKLSNIPSVSYFSVYDALCSSAGCMTSTTGDASDLTSFDYGHLTISAAKFVARKLIDNSPLRHLKY